MFYPYFAVNGHDSRAYGNVDMTRKHISFNLDPRNMMLSLRIGFSFVRAAMAFINLERTSGFEPSSGTIYPKELEAPECFYLLTLISLWLSSALFANSLASSANICILYTGPKKLGIRIFWSL